MAKTKLEELTEAIRSGDQNSLERLLNEDPQLLHGALPNAASPILLALYYGRGDMANWLAGRAAPIDVFSACAIGNLERVRQCVESAPESVNSFASDGYFPLGLAAFFGHTEIVRFLLEHGADVRLAARNSARVTALHGAVTRGAEDIVRMLLEHGADPNARQNWGYVPLQSAAAAGHKEIARLLIEHGADAAARSEDGKTASDLAGERGHPAIAEWLKQYVSNQATKP